MGDSLFIVDDHNLDSINYDTQNLWFPRASIDSAIQGTLTEGLAGAKASMTFSGTALAVFGLATTVTNSAPPSVQFSIDGRVLQTTTAPNNGSVNFEFPFFDIEDLSSAQHLLEFTVVNATQDYPFALDFIAYQPISGATPTASQQVVTSFLPAPTSVLSTPAPASSSSGAPVGAIVGGVVGGVALLVAAAIAVYLLCFRHRRKGDPAFYAARGQASDLLDQESKPTPYEVPPTTPSALGAQSRYSAGPTSAYSAPSAYGTPGLAYVPSAPYTPSEAPVSDYSAGTSTSGPSHPSSLYIATSAQALRNSPNQPRSKAAEAGLLSVPQPATFHADSGIRFNSDGEPSSSSAGAAHVLAAPELADVPPTYSEA